MNLAEELSDADELLQRAYEYIVDAMLFTDDVRGSVILKDIGAWMRRVSDEATAKLEQEKRTSIQVKSFNALDENAIRYCVRVLSEGPDASMAPMDDVEIKLARGYWCLEKCHFYENAIGVCSEIVSAYLNFNSRGVK